MNCWPFHCFIKCAFFTFHQMPFAACQSVTIALPRVILECTTHNGVAEWMMLSFNWHKHQDPIVLLTLLQRGTTISLKPQREFERGCIIDIIHNRSFSRLCRAWSGAHAACGPASRGGLPRPPHVARKQFAPQRLSCGDFASLENLFSNHSACLDLGKTALPQMAVKLLGPDALAQIPPWLSGLDHRPDKPIATDREHSGELVFGGSG